MRRFFASLCLSLLLSAIMVTAQAAKDGAAGAATPVKGPGTITGTVMDAATAEPLPGAVVIVVGTKLGANTDAEGRFIISTVVPGTYAIQAKMMGYTPMTVTGVTVAKGYTVKLDFPLHAAALEAKEVVIATTGKMVVADATTKTTVINAGAGATAGVVASPERPAPAASGDKGTIGGKAEEMAYGGDLAKPPEPIHAEPPAYPEIARSTGTPAPAAAPRPRPASPGMKAGSNDDNKQFNYYLGYLEKFSKVKAIRLDVSGRVVFTVTDEAGGPVANCPLAVKDRHGTVLARRLTYADGRAMFFTTEDKRFGQQDLTVEAALDQQKTTGHFSHNGKSQVDLKLPGRRPDFNNVPLDVVFLLDCTGSMGDEISRLKSTLQLINFQISQLPSRPAVRFGLVQYRDRGDEYVTRVTPLTASADSFQKVLDAVAAAGGGDEPEDVQSGLKDAVTGLSWRGDACKLVFLVADAPPHLDYADQAYTYADAMREAAGKGIKIISVGASGLNDQGEYVFRQLSQYTMGQFVFLTYGEKGEVSGGGTTYVSHHTGSNFQTENLDAIIVRIVKQELAHYGDGTPDADPEYFATNYTGAGDKDAILKELFAEGVRQLLDYAIVRIDEGSPSAVMPVAFTDEALRPKAEVLEDKIVLNLAGVKAFRLVERKDLRQIMEEQKLSLTGAFDDAHTVEVGKLIGAKILILPKLHKGKDKLELYLKLVKVETGEIMSITLLKLDEGLI